MAQDLVYMHGDDTVIRLLAAEAHRREVAKSRDHTESLDRDIEFLLHTYHLLNVTEQMFDL